jgi:hypothetical protein
MSQYAGLYAVSKRLDVEMVFLQEFIHLERGIKLFEGFDIPKNVKSIREINFDIYEIKEVECDNEVFCLDPNKNWDLRGWFHLYHYFDRFRAELMQVFKFKENIVKKSLENLQSIRSGDDTPLVSVHFRRGDYLQVSSLNLDSNYYESAIKKIYDLLPDFKLLVFSDDIDWCKENIVGDNVFYSEGNNNYVDMCMMSMCEHNIIANSTFSWWGAYLNKNPRKIVVCPEDYVGRSSENFINKNYYPKDWMSLSLN